MNWSLRWDFNLLEKWYMEHLEISIPATIILVALGLFCIYKEDKAKREKFFKEDEENDNRRKDSKFK